MTTGGSCKAYRAALLSAAASVAVAAALGGEALADCAPDPATTGASVTCTGTDADGFAPGAAVEDLDIVVVSGADTAALILFGDDNTILNEGTIADAAVAPISITDGVGADITNNGTISATASPGLLLTNVQNYSVLNNAGGVIESTGGTAAVTFVEGFDVPTTGLFENNGDVIAGAGAGVRVEGNTAIVNFTLNNTGVIDAAGDGVFIEQFSSFTGDPASFTINNSGTINAGAFAVNVESFETVTSLTNSGLLSSGDGVSIQNRTISVVNDADGIIRALNDDAAALSVVGVAAGSTTSIINDGLIEATGVNANGVVLNTAAFTFENNGIVRTLDPGAEAITIADGFGFSGVLTNRGLIDASNGAAFNLGLNDQLTFVNEGEIRGTARLGVLDSDGSFSFLNTGTFTDALTVFGAATEFQNEGDIAAGVDASAAFASVNITNSGLLGDVLLGAAEDSYTQTASGSFTGIIDGSAGTDVLDLEIGDAGLDLDSANIIEFEQFTKRGSGRLNLTGALELQGDGDESFFNIADGEAFLQSGATISSGFGDGFVNVLDGGRFTSSGDILGNLVVSGVFEPRPVADDVALQVSGDINFTDTSLTTLTYNGSQEVFIETESDAVVGGALNVDVDAPLMFYNFLLIDSLNDTTSGAFDNATVTDGFVIFVDVNPSDVRVRIGPPIVPERQIDALQAAPAHLGMFTARRMTDLALKRANRQNINNPAIDAIPKSPSFGFGEAGGLPPLSSEMDLSNLTSLQPLPGQSAPGDGTAFRTIWLTPRVTAFAGTALDFGKISNSSGQTGFRYTAVHAMTGVDYYFTPWIYSGIAAGYSYTDGSYKFDVGDIDLSAVNTSAYAAYVGEDGVYLNAAMNFSWNNYDLKRNVDEGFETSGETEADLDGYGFAFDILTGKDYGDEQRSLGTYSGLSFSRVRISDYNEVDALDRTFVSNIGSQAVSSLQAIAGVRASMREKKEWGVLVPYVNLGLELELLDQGRTLVTVNKLAEVGRRIGVLDQSANLGVNFSGGLNAVLNDRTVVSGYLDLGFDQDGVGGFSQSLGVVFRRRL